MSRASTTTLAFTVLLLACVLAGHIHEGVYFITDNIVSLDEAENECHKTGNGSLVEVLSLETFNMIAQYFPTADVWLNARRRSLLQEPKFTIYNLMCEECKMRSMDYCRNCEYLLSAFEWKRSRKALTSTPLFLHFNGTNTFLFETFYVREPTVIYGGKEENCLAMFSGKFNDLFCTAQRHALCTTQGNTFYNQELNVTGNTVFVGGDLVLTGSSIMTMDTLSRVTIQGCPVIEDGATIRMSISPDTNTSVVILMMFDDHCEPVVIETVDLPENACVVQDKTSVRVLFDSSRCPSKKSGVETKVPVMLVSIVAVVVIIVIAIILGVILTQVGCIRRHIYPFERKTVARGRVATIRVSK